MYGYSPAYFDFLKSSFQGFMADRLGSYNPTFYTTGAVMIAGTLITSLMAFVKQQPERTEVLLSIGEELLVTEKVSVV